MKWPVNNSYRSRVQCLTMDLYQYVDEATVAALQRLLPNVIFNPIVKPIASSKASSVSIELPAASGGEYLFVLFFSPQRQIHARLLPANTRQYYFWYRPFEDAEFGNSIEKLDCAFMETVEQLISNETRIIQKRGLLTNSFKCDYRSLSGWKTVSGQSALRIRGFVVPPIDGKQRIYHSPALILL